MYKTLVDCKTYAGNSCHFPFQYNGSEYNACIERDSPGKPWCATNEIYTIGSGNFGYCSKSCPVQG